MKSLDLTLEERHEEKWLFYLNSRTVDGPKGPASTSRLAAHRLLSSEKFTPRLHPKNSGAATGNRCVDLGSGCSRYFVAEQQNHDISLAGLSS
jgi:hypothetical protein